MKKTLIIHAGLHKTGTSFLQETLYNNKDLLNSHGWDFLHSDKSGNSSSHISVTKENKLKSTVKDSFFSLIKQSSQNNAIISAEYLSFLSEATEIQKIKDVCQETFESIKIIFYLRSQDELALSFKQQSAKSPLRNQMPSSMLMGHDLSVFPSLNDDIRKYFYYYEKITLWASIFNKENIILDTYNKETDKELFFENFLKKFGITINAYSKPEKKINLGLSRQETIIKNYLLSRGLKNTNIKKSTSITENEKIKPSIKEAYEFYSNFIDNNKKLESEYSIKLPFDSNLYSEESNYHINYHDIDLIINTVNNIEQNQENNNVKITKNTFHLIRDYIFNNTKENFCQLSYNLLDSLRKEREKENNGGHKIRNQQIEILKQNVINMKFSKESRFQYYIGIYDSMNNEFSNEFIRDMPFNYSLGLCISTPGSYISDINEILSRINNKFPIPILFGDKPNSNNCFCFNKSRKIDDFSGTLLRLNKKRHWDDFIDFHDDIKTEDKVNSIIWRGASTGYGNEDENDRFILVSKHHKNHNIGFSKLVQGRKWENYLKDKLTIKEQLNYKYILVVEGNDVATSLKWVLKSNSIPFMKNPKKETWLMEGLLKPYVHYIPLNSDFSDLDEKIHWANENNDKVLEISENGKSFMQTFEDEEAERWIENELVNFYIKNSLK